MIFKKVKKKNVLVALLIIVLLAIYLYVLTLINYRCPVHEILKIWCPGCGGTRMIVSFLHLDFYQSFRWNPLLFIYLIFFIIYLIICIVFYLKKKEIPVPTTKTLIIIAATLIIYMIIRNISIFSYLIPTKI